MHYSSWFGGSSSHKGTWTACPLKNRKLSSPFSAEQVWSFLFVEIRNRHSLLSIKENHMCVQKLEINWIGNPCHLLLLGCSEFYLASFHMSFVLSWVALLVAIWLQIMSFEHALFSFHRPDTNFVCSILSTCPIYAHGQLSIIRHLSPILPWRGNESSPSWTTCPPL